MDDKILDDLTATERAAFAALPRDAAPPPALEGRVVAALTQRGILRDRRSRALRFGVPFGALAAAVILFAAGLATGRREKASAPADARPEFVLFLQEGMNFDRASGNLAEYKAWARALGKQGLIVGSEKLEEKGLLLSRSGRDVVVEKETVEAPSVARGYFVIRARDLDQALSIAKDCPHLKHGGRISLRPIEKV